MSYRDEGAGAARDEQLVIQRDEALARARRLEAQLVEARTWLKNRSPVTGGWRQLGQVGAWAGLGSLGGSTLGAVLWLALGNPILIPVLGVLGCVGAGLAALGGKIEDDGFPEAPPPRE